MSESGWSGEWVYSDTYQNDVTALGDAIIRSLRLSDMLRRMARTVGYWRHEAKEARESAKSTDYWVECWKTAANGVLTTIGERDRERDRAERAEARVRELSDALKTMADYGDGYRLDRLTKDVIEQVIVRLNIIKDEAYPNPCTLADCIDALRGHTPAQGSGFTFAQAWEDEDLREDGDDGR